jgi:hypothetical protein
VHLKARFRHDHESSILVPDVHILVENLASVVSTKGHHEAYITLFLPFLKRTTFLLLVEFPRVNNPGIALPGNAPSAGILASAQALPSIGSFHRGCRNDTTAWVGMSLVESEADIRIESY